jgi:type VI secretion system secreted protein VgrG
LIRKKIKKGEIMSLINQLDGFNRRFSFLCDELDAGTTLEVVSFEGEESLGRLYRFEILLVSARNDIDEQKLLGQQAVFQLNDGMPDGEDTRYCGLITAFEQQHQVTGWTFYKAVLEPKLWRLGKFHLTEVYLNKTPRELLEIILGAGGLNSNDYTLAYLQPGEYPPQKFICQYRESYLGFITRWCEHLGVYWWYAQHQSSEQIVFGNNYRNHNPQVINLVYQPAGELDANVTGARRVQCFNLFSQPLPRQVTVTNYFYQKASLQIKGSAIVSEQGIGEVNYYGMNVESNETAQEIARIRAEGLICRGRQFSGESTATGLRCGYFLELSGHYRAGFNQKYMLTRVFHRGSQASLLLAGLGVQTAEPDKTFYHAEFSAIPSGVQFRPELLHPWPRIEGTLNAFIDAEGSGKYAELNEEGEYKVQLPYSLTEKGATKASAWIRMSSPYAGVDDTGSNHGMHFPLHKGTEVLLSFHNGNPDKPVIIGAVTNSQTPNVVTDENQTQSVIQTAGGNSMEFHDQEGQVGMHFHSPTADTYFSMGAPLPAAKGVGSEASQDTSDLTETVHGFNCKTSGNFKIDCQNKKSNIWGASTSFIAGANTSNVMGAYTSSTLGLSTTNVGGAKTTFVVGAVLDVLMAGVVKITPAEVKACRNYIRKNVLGIYFSNAEIEEIVTSITKKVNEITDKYNSFEVITEAKIKQAENDFTLVGACVEDAKVAIVRSQAKVEAYAASIRKSNARATQHMVDVNNGVSIFNPD